MREVYTTTKEDVSPLAQKVILAIKQRAKNRAVVIHLEGDLGAGKTFFVQELAKSLHVIEQVTSPTFVLQKEYKTSDAIIKTLIHIDAYRFVSKDEAKVLALPNSLLPHTCICIEWPGNMSAPEPDAHLTFSYVDEDTRRIIVDIKNE